VNAREFHQAVQNHPTLVYEGVSEGSVVVGHMPSKTTTALPPASILKHPWPHLEAALTGRRPLVAMIHLSRIVGYFSLTRNWNKSKLAELRDRHRARDNYRLPEPAEDTDWPEDGGLPCDVAGIMRTGRVVCALAEPEEG